METKLRRLSRITVPKGDRSPDSIVRSKAINMNDRARGQEILMEAQACYMSMHKFREERARNERYLNGDQWSDIIEIDEGGITRRITEEKYLKEQGCVPLKTNLIRKKVDAVKGLFIGQQTEPTCIARDRDEQQEAETLSTLLQYNMQLNRMRKLNADSIEEYLKSGFVMHRKWAGWNNAKQKEDCWTEFVEPNNMFVDNYMRDFRGWDCSLIGELHDLSYNEVMRYAKTPEDYQRLEKIFEYARDIRAGEYSWEQFGYSEQDIHKEFMCPTDSSRCRVIEVWRKESKPRYRCHDWNSGEVYKIDIKDYNAMVYDENQRRKIQATQAGIPENEIPFITAEWFMDSYWYYYFLSPFGDIIEEGESPYAHKEHPYVFSGKPKRAFTADTLDQQRYINRLYSLNDMILRSSAKGVLIVPREGLKNTTLENIMDQWAKPNGVIVVDVGTSGKLPQQVASNATNIGINEMLSMQLKMMDDITGVNSSLQGKSEYAGMSAAMFSMQTQNATTTLQGILNDFQEFMLDAAYKDVKNIQQFYDEKKVLRIVGKTANGFPVNARKALDTEVDISIVPSQATPVYRAFNNDTLLELWKQGAINVKMLLRHGSFAFADALLQDIEAQEQQAAAGQMPQGVSPELMQQVQQGANMEAVQKAQQALAA
ncbi:MAG: hypothetical protein IKJ78_06180 [Bacteroidales bacterium]|nr:hypothetical protein [Bacteroidales bacterium]